MSHPLKLRGRGGRKQIDNQLRTLPAAGASCSIITELFKRSQTSNPQAGSRSQDQVGPFAARAEDEKHPETEGEGEMKELKADRAQWLWLGHC